MSLARARLNLVVFVTNGREWLKVSIDETLYPTIIIVIIIMIITIMIAHKLQIYPNLLLTVCFRRRADYILSTYIISIYVPIAI